LKREVFDPAKMRGAGKTVVPPEIEGLASQVVDAAIRVHRTLRPGFPESVYEKALSIELSERGLAHETQAPVQVYYRGQLVGEGRIDILVEDRLVVELKTVDQLSSVHVGQVLGYLQAKNLPLGLLLNFHAAVLRDGLRRVIL
jgi:GxxExxY protein